MNKGKEVHEITGWCFVLNKEVLKHLDVLSTFHRHNSHQILIT